MERSREEEERRAERRDAHDFMLFLAERRSFFDRQLTFNPHDSSDPIYNETRDDDLFGLNFIVNRIFALRE